VTENVVYAYSGDTSRTNGTIIWWNPRDGALGAAHEVIHASGAPDVGNDPKDLMSGGPGSERADPDAKLSQADIDAIIRANGKGVTGRLLSRTYVLDSYGRVAPYHPLTGAFSWSIPGLSDIAMHFEGGDTVPAGGFILGGLPGGSSGPGGGFWGPLIL
jgi:hypothetical protein